MVDNTGTIAEKLVKIHVLLPKILFIFYYLFFIGHNQPECVSHQDSHLRSWLLCEQTWGTGRAGLLPSSLGTLACKAEQENQPAKTRHDSTAPGKDRSSVLPGNAIWIVWLDLAAGSLAVQFSAITSWKEILNVSRIYSQKIGSILLVISFNQWASSRLLCTYRSMEGIQRGV